MSEQLRGACIFGQSGGPTSVINASAYGVIRTALDAGLAENTGSAQLFAHEKCPPNND